MKTRDSVIYRRNADGTLLYMIRENKCIELNLDNYVNDINGGGISVIAGNVPGNVSYLKSIRKKEFMKFFKMATEQVQVILNGKKTQSPGKAEEQ